MVEFALILPLLVVLVFATIEFGLILFNKQVITNAGREGARFGIVVPDESGNRRTAAQITAEVLDYSRDYLVSFGAFREPQVTVTMPAAPSFGDDLRVQVTYQYDFLLLPNFLAAFFGGDSLSGQINLLSAATMKYE